MLCYDHIVIGVGSMGSAACYYLARNGSRVLGLEQFSIAHDKGSHGGESRIIRKAYFEHPDYIPLLIRAYENWDHISALSGKTLIHRTGLFYAGPAGNELLNQVKRSAEMYDIKLEHRSFRLFELPGNYECFFEPDAGYVEPENTIRAYVQAARSLGADVRQHVKVNSWSVDEDSDHPVLVHTDDGLFACRKLVITAGPWSAKLIPGIEHRLKVTLQVLAWMQPREPERFQAPEFPCWMITDGRGPGVYYGFPVLEHGTKGIKLAYHYAGEPTDPDAERRAPDDRDIQPLQRFLQEHIPAAGSSLLQDKTCLYSNSPDEHFVIDNLPGMEDHVCMAWGFSGHGFKFVPVVGEILADLAIKGNTELPIGFLSAGRFRQ